jgi:DNA invertase Pin-like site-specific DNA recombinase
MICSSLCRVPFMSVLLSWVWRTHILDGPVFGGWVNRKGFKALFADAAKHRFDVVLFWSLDRLTREGTFKTHCYLRQLSDSGVKFKSFTEQYVDSLGIFGDAIIGLLAAMAQQERVRISDRTKAGIQRAKAQGKTWKRGIAPRAASKTTLWRRAKALRPAA